MKHLAVISGSVPGVPPPPQVLAGVSNVLAKLSPPAERVGRVLFLTTAAQAVGGEGIGIQTTKSERFFHLTLSC